MKYYKQKGARIKSYGFTCITIYDHGAKYWYYPHLHNWVDDSAHPEVIGKDCASFEPCRSLKAAIRKVNKTSVPKGTVFTLMSRYVGYDIDIVKRG